MLERASTGALFGSRLLHALVGRGFYTTARRLRLGSDSSEARALFFVNQSARAEPRRNGRGASRDFLPRKVAR